MSASCGFVVAMTDMTGLRVGEVRGMILAQMFGDWLAR